MSVGFTTNFSKTVGPNFIIKNATAGAATKNIIVFGIKMAPGTTYDLLNIPNVSEADIQHSLLKGELKRRFLTGDIELVSSTLNLVVFDAAYRAYLVSKGFSTGLDSITRDIRYPQIRIIAGSVNEPPATEAGPTMGWLFDLFDRAYFEVPLAPMRDPTKDIIIGVGWATSATEANTFVSWQIDVTAMYVGRNLTEVDTTLTLSDLPGTAVALYNHDAFTVPVADLDPNGDELHVRLIRYPATGNDASSPPGLHHIIVIQDLIQV